MVVEILIPQVLLIVVLGIWLGAHFRDSPFIRFFDRNDWFVGIFLILVGYMNYLVYTTTYLRNLNIVLIVIGVILVLFSAKDMMKK